MDPSRTSLSSRTWRPSPGGKWSELLGEHEGRDHLSVCVFVCMYVCMFVVDGDMEIVSYTHDHVHVSLYVDLMVVIILSVCLPPPPLLLPWIDD